MSKAQAGSSQLTAQQAIMIRCCSLPPKRLPVNRPYVDRRGICGAIFWDTAKFYCKVKKRRAPNPGRPLVFTLFIALPEFSVPSPRVCLREIRGWRLSAGCTFGRGRFSLQRCREFHPRP